MKNIQKVILSFLILLNTALFPVQKEGVNFKDSLILDQKKIVINGIGLKELTVLKLNLFVAALYLPEKTNNGPNIINSNVQKKIMIHFVRDFNSEDLRNLFKESYNRNSKQLNAIKIRKTVQQDFSKFINLLESVKENDTLIFSFSPTKGLLFQLKQRNKATFKSFHFQRIIFSFFLGQHPMDKKLKSGLLGL